MSDKKIVCPEYNSLVADHTKALEAIQKKGKTAVTALFKAFFTKYPQVQAVAWTQYVPQFNDGDPCYFRFRTFFLSVKTGVDFSRIYRLQDEGEEDDAHGLTDEYSLTDKALKQALSSIENSADRKVFEAAFGDNAVVIATREGFHVSEYDA